MDEDDPEVRLAPLFAIQPHPPPRAAPRNCGHGRILRRRRAGRARRGWFARALLWRTSLGQVKRARPQSPPPPSPTRPRPPQCERRGGRDATGASAAESFKVRRRRYRVCVACTGAVSGRGRWFGTRACEQTGFGVGDWVGFGGDRELGSPEERRLVSACAQTVLWECTGTYPSSDSISRGESSRRPFTALRALCGVGAGSSGSRVLP